MCRGRVQGHGATWQARCENNDRALVCIYKDLCTCSAPGCTCSLLLEAMRYDHLEADSVEVGVNVSCASIRRPDAPVYIIRLFANSQSRAAQELRRAAVGPQRCFTQQEAAPARDDYGEPVRGTSTSTVHALCHENLELLPAESVRELKHVKLTSLEVQVGPGARCSRRDDGACDSESPRTLHVHACMRVCA